MQKVARSSFSLLVRVVDGLADCDFDDATVTELLTEFMAELVADGELNLARALRSKFIQKFEARQARRLPDLDTSGLTLSNKPTSILHFKVGHFRIWRHIFDLDRLLPYLRSIFFF